MTDQIWILPLKTGSGQPCGFAHVRQNRSGVGVQFSFRSGTSLLPGDAIYLLSERETLALESDTASVPLTAPACGILILRGGSCIYQGVARNAKINLEREKTKLRMAHYAAGQKQPAPVKQEQPSAPPDNPQTAARGQDTPQAGQNTHPVQQPTPGPADAGPKPAYYNQPACDCDPGASDRHALEGLPRPDAKCIPKEAPQGKKPGNSRALQQILQRAKTVFEPEACPQANEPVCGSVQADCSVDSYKPKPPASLWEEEVAKILSQDRPTHARENVAVRTTPAQPPSLTIPNPFQNVFPHSSWKKVFRPQGQGWFLQGEMHRGREVIYITAIPGEYQAVPPRQFQGFSRYIKARDGGYWVRCTKGRNS